jgi:hypothetical protein
MSGLIPCTIAPIQSVAVLNATPVRTPPQELESDGVDASMVLRAAGHPSPFTYIIVDKSGG